MKDRPEKATVRRESTLCADLFLYISGHNETCPYQSVILYEQVLFGSPEFALSVKLPKYRLTCQAPERSAAGESEKRACVYLSIKT